MNTICGANLYQFIFVWLTVWATLHAWMRGYVARNRSVESSGFLGDLFGSFIVATAIMVIPMGVEIFNLIWDLLGGWM